MILENLRNIIGKLKNNVSGYYFFAIFNCSDENMETCSNEFYINNFPSLRLYGRIGNLKAKIQSYVELPLNAKDLKGDLLMEFANDNLKEATTASFHNFLAQTRKLNKLPVLHFYVGVRKFK